MLSDIQPNIFRMLMSLIFCRQLNAAYEDFPDDFLKMKVLPELLKAAEYAGGGPQVLSLAIKIGAKLPDDDFEMQMSQNLIRLYASPDRATRVCLLDSLPQYVDRFSQKIVNDKIFPQIVRKHTCPKRLMTYGNDLLMVTLGHRFHRHHSCSARANCKVHSIGSTKIIRSNAQWRASKASGKNYQ